MTSNALSKIVLLLALPAIALGAMDKATVADILKDPKKFDQKELQVTGFVKDFKQKTSKAGNKYFTFKLKESKDAEKDIAIYSQGSLEKELKDNDKVEVTGIFRAENKVGEFTYKNEIDCSSKEGKKFGVKELK